MRRIVIDRISGHRTDDADLVGNRADVRKQRTDLCLALAKLFEREHGPKTEQFLALQLGKLLPLSHALGHRLAIEFGKFRFVIERFKL